MYKDGMKHLMIYETSVDTERVNNLEERLKQKDSEIVSLKQEMQDMKMKLLELYVVKHEKHINGKNKEQL